MRILFVATALLGLGVLPLSAAEGAIVRYALSFTDPMAGRFGERAVVINSGRRPVVIRPGQSVIMTPSIIPLGPMGRAVPNRSGCPATPARSRKVIYSRPFRFGRFSVAVTVVRHCYGQSRLGRYTDRFTVGYKGQASAPVESFLGLQNLDPAKAIAAARRSVELKQGYLFVHWDNGGNGSGHLVEDEVFKIDREKLIDLGGVHNDGAPGASFRGGRFYDQSGPFEGGVLTPCDACLLRFSRVLLDKNDRFVVDSDATWRANHGSFLNNLKKIASALKREGKRAEKREECGNNAVCNARLCARLACKSLLFDAVIAKYCRRERESERVAALARRLLPGQWLADFAKAMASVKPGKMNGLDGPDP